MKHENRLTTAVKNDRKLLSVYITAGYPALSDTVPLCEALQDAGVDLIEIGFPFSDPLADGPIIQRSSEIALKNGMSLERLFEQLSTIRRTVTIPLLLMGYLNPVLQFGSERFVHECARCGIDGLIIPDLPLDEYKRELAALLAEQHMHFIFLITQHTPEARIREIDALGSGFIYAVSSPSVTGAALTIDAARAEYFKRLAQLKLKNPLLVGFGISDSRSFAAATKHCKGAIIGSAFIKALGAGADIRETAKRFIATIR
jgi:tryptophan synthase alpha chain